MGTPNVCERAGRLVIGLWLSLFGWVGAALSVVRIALSESAPGAPALVSLGLGLLWILAGLSAFRGRFAPVVPLLLLLALPGLLEQVDATDAPASSGPRTRWRDAADQLLASLSIVWLLARWLETKSGFRKLAQGASAALGASFVLCLPPFSEGIGVALAGLADQSSLPMGFMPGQRVPDLRVISEDGSLMPLYEPRGLTVLLFWATWCGPCLEELPEVDRIAAKHSGGAAVSFIAINTESLGAEELHRFRERKGLWNLKFGAVSGEAKTRLGVAEIPQTWLVREGILVYRKIGYGAANLGELERILRREAGEGTGNRGRRSLPSGLDAARVDRGRATSEGRGPGSGVAGRVPT